MRGEGGLIVDYSFLQDCPGAIVKPEPRQKEKARKDRKAMKATKDVREYVMARERDLCRVCRCRPAESLHELKPRGIGGKRSKKNSVGTCGQIVGAVPSCHTYLQSHAIEWGGSVLGAEAELIFTAMTREAADWLKVKVGEQIVSRPMQEVEAEA